MFSLETNLDVDLAADEGKHGMSLWNCHILQETSAGKLVEVLRRRDHLQPTTSICSVDFTRINKLIHKARESIEDKKNLAGVNSLVHLLKKLCGSTNTARCRTEALR